MNPITIKKNVKVITVKEEDSLDRYFKEISRIKLLTPTEEVELAKLSKQGDKKAFDTLVESNLRFVVSVAKQYQNKGVLLLDLINEGNLGLIHAVKTFDESRGYRFISYAVYWIRQAILAALTKQSHLIHIPFNQYYLASKVNRVYEEEKSKGNHNITEEELSTMLDLDIEDIQNSLYQQIHTVSLDNTLSVDDEKSTLADVIKNDNIKSPDANLMENSMLRDILNFLHKVLDEREEQVIIMNYGIGGNSSMSFQEIGDRLGLTKECIRQIKEKALRKLRLHDGNVILKQYL